MKNIDLLKDVMNKDVNVEILHETYENIGFPMSEVEFLNEKNPIIDFKTYVILNQIIMAFDIENKINSYVTDIFKDISEEDHMVICNFIYMTIHGYYRYLLSKERFYENEQAIYDDILKHTKMVFECLDDSPECTSDTINSSEIPNKETIESTD